MSDRLDDLQRMRRSLLDALGEVEAKERPRVTRELRAVNVELESLAPPAKADPIDDLKARRVARIAAS